MGTNNHLMAVVCYHGHTRELDIQFRYGELREHYYHIGDCIHGVSDGEDNNVIVVPGLAILCNDNSEEITYLYYRIIIMQGRLISFFLTTEQDFNLLEASCS